MGAHGIVQFKNMALPILCPTTKETEGFNAHIHDVADIQNLQNIHCVQAVGFILKTETEGLYLPICPAEGYDLYGNPWTRGLYI